VALVTASTGGIGFAIARGLAESGAEVIVNGRSTESVNKGIQQLQQVVPGVQVRAAIADLSTAEGVESLLKVANNVDILVNNAGIYGPQDFYATDDETWERYWQTNVMSACVCPAPCCRAWCKKAGDAWCLSPPSRPAIFRRI
jgi:NAD(P)-dependent dehydrogenase (short-subunit alcohol dehydrogenase family)